MPRTRHAQRVVIDPVDLQRQHPERSKVKPEPGRSQPHPGNFRQVSTGHGKNPAAHRLEKRVLTVVDGTPVIDYHNSPWTKPSQARRRSRRRAANRQARISRRINR